MLLILDLDDTLFETKSIDFSMLAPAQEVIESYTIKAFGEEQSRRIVERLKELPFDVVAKEYAFPQQIIEAFYHELEHMHYDLNIQPYADYQFLRAIQLPKILVTTGFPKLQQAKIDALRITSDFEETHIDNPLETNRKGKKKIFQEIVARRNHTPEQVWVIGDNPMSEIKAGKELGINTIQRMHQQTEKSIYSDHHIRSFEELTTILTQQQ